MSETIYYMISHQISGELMFIFEHRPIYSKDEKIITSHRMDLSSHLALGLLKTKVKKPSMFNLIEIAGCVMY